MSASDSWQTIKKENNQQQKITILQNDLRHLSKRHNFKQSKGTSV